MLTSVQLTCHRCGHRWTYMGTKLRQMERNEWPVRIRCGRCGTTVTVTSGGFDPPGSLWGGR